MKKIQKLAESVLQGQEDAVRFSVSLIGTDNTRLEKMAELMGRSKSAFCSDLIAAALDDLEEVMDRPEAPTDSQLPSAEEYLTAFQGIENKLTEKHRAMLLTHIQAPNCKTTATKLATAAGYKHYGAVNLQYARIGQMLAEHLGRAVPKHRDGSPFPTAFLVEWEFRDVWYCTLHPQAIAALRKILPAK
jgi:hypothetical protein